jgi:hypothetical protein
LPAGGGIVLGGGNGGRGMAGRMPLEASAPGRTPLEPPPLGAGRWAGEGVERGGNGRMPLVPAVGFAAGAAGFAGLAGGNGVRPVPLASAANRVAVLSPVCGSAAAGSSAAMSRTDEEAVAGSDWLSASKASISVPETVASPGEDGPTGGMAKRVPASRAGDTRGVLRGAGTMPCPELR